MPGQKLGQSSIVPPAWTTWLFPDSQVVERQVAGDGALQDELPRSGVDVFAPLPEVPMERQGVAAERKGVAESGVVMDDDPGLGIDGLMVFGRAAAGQHPGAVRRQRNRDAPAVRNVPLLDLNDRVGI